MVSFILVLQAVSSGLVVTGERGQGLSILLLIFVNTLLPILLAFSLDGFRTKRAIVLAVLAVTLILFLNASLVDGSRRGVAFFFIFIALPLFVHIGVFRRAGAIALMASAACIVVFYGMLRKGLNDVRSIHDFTSLIHFNNFSALLDSMLVNADFAMVFDALVGVIKRVPEEVGYLYGDTLFKFFYFPIPRSVWPDKPESISVVVAKRIYEVGDSPVSFNPTIIGELYFNLGWIGLCIGGGALGLLLALMAVLVRKLESGCRLSYLVVTGFVSMAMFNVWRGYTFEVIFGLAIFLVIFFGVEFVLRRSTWRQQCS